MAACAWISAAGSDGAGGLSLRGVAQVAQDARPAPRRRRTARSRWGSTRGSGSIALSAADGAWPGRSAASLRRRASSSAALAVVVGGRGAARSRGGAASIWSDSSFVDPPRLVELLAGRLLRRQKSGSSLASRSSACRASFLRSSITWASGWPKRLGGAARSCRPPRGRLRSGNRCRPSLPAGGWIDLASRAIASSRAAERLHPGGEGVFLIRAQLVLVAEHRRRASSISPLRASWRRTSRPARALGSPGTSSMSRASRRSSFSAPSRRWRAWSMSPRSIGSAAWRISSMLSRDRPFSASGGSTSRASRRASSSSARWASARALSSAACWDRSAACRVSSRWRSARARACAGQAVGLAASASSRAPRRSGRLAHQAIEVVPHGVLPGLEPVELGAVAGPGPRPRRRAVAGAGQLVEPAALRVSWFSAFELALEFVEPLADGAEPVAGLAEVGEATLPGRRLAGRGRASRGPLSASSSAIWRAGRASGRSRRVLGRDRGRAAGVGRSDCAGVRLAALDGLLPRLVPSAVAAPGRVGGLAKPFGLLPIGRRGLLRARRAVACIAERRSRLSRASIGSAPATIVSSSGDDQATFGPRGAGRLSATRSRYVRPSPGLRPSDGARSEAMPRADREPRPGRLDRDVAGLRLGSRSSGRDGSRSAARPRRPRRRRARRLRRSGCRPGSTSFSPSRPRPRDRRRSIGPDDHPARVRAGCRSRARRAAPACTGRTPRRRGSSSPSGRHRPGSRRCGTGFVPAGLGHPTLDRADGPARRDVERDATPFERLDPGRVAGDRGRAASCRPAARPGPRSPRRPAARAS